MSPTATKSGFPPHLSEPKPEYVQLVCVFWNRVVVEAALHDRLEPLSGLHNRVVRAVEELPLDFFKLGSRSLTNRFALHHKVPVLFLPADMRKAQEV